MASEDKSKRKTWTAVETRGLLKCYLARRKEFLHQRKKRNAYAHVLEDMQAQGFTNSSTTVIALENKMRTLLSAYKSAKDNTNRTGASSYIAPYMESLEEIFGDSVLAGNSHTLSVGLVRSPPLLTINCVDESETLNEIQVTIDSFVNADSITTISPVPSTSATSTPPHQPSQPTRRRKTAKERYYETKIKIKMQKLEEKKRFNNSVLQTIREVELEKLQILKRSLYR